jgi:low affinity Fe/Cu permease
MTSRPVGSSLTALGAMTAKPWACFQFLLYIVLWLVFDASSVDWHAVATMATWAMTLVIQRAEHRDTQAIHAKLDELLRADTQADGGLSHIDDEEPEDIEKQRQG